MTELELKRRIKEDPWFLDSLGIIDKDTNAIRDNNDELCMLLRALEEDEDEAVNCPNLRGRAYSRHNKYKEKQRIIKRWKENYSYSFRTELERANMFRYYKFKHMSLRNDSKYRKLYRRVEKKKDKVKCREYINSHKWLEDMVEENV